MILRTIKNLSRVPQSCKLTCLSRLSSSNKDPEIPEKPEHKESAEKSVENSEKSVIQIIKDEESDVELPPEPTDCCMSGCQNCVWIVYAETLTKMYDDGGEKAKKIILTRIQDPTMKVFLKMELSSFK